MKRDIDLVRKILIDASKADGPIPIDALTDENNGKQLVGYHISIMKEAGLINATIQTAGGDPYYFCCISSLTWEGNDFLDAVQNENVWSKVKTTLSESVGTTTFEVIKTLAINIGQTVIQSQLDI